MILRLVPPGTFVMGSPSFEEGRDDDETQHDVVLTHPFYMGVTEVTRGNMLKAFGEDPTPEDMPDRPVQGVAWLEARDFCRRLGCDLPTEAQWEYASRGGSAGTFWWGDRREDGLGRANVFDHAAARGTRFAAEFPFDDGFSGIAPAARVAANGFGLHDTLGNVWEWCLDGYEGDYGHEPVDDPVVRPEGSARIIRGGSWKSTSEECRLAARLALPMGKEDEQFGFRVALTLPR